MFAGLCSTCFGIKDNSATVLPHGEQQEVAQLHAWKRAGPAGDSRYDAVAVGHSCASTPENVEPKLLSSPRPPGPSPSSTDDCARADPSRPEQTGPPSTRHSTDWQRHHAASASISLSSGRRSHSQSQSHTCTAASALGVHSHHSLLHQATGSNPSVGATGTGTLSLNTLPTAVLASVRSEGGLEVTARLNVQQPGTDASSSAANIPPAGMLLASDNSTSRLMEYLSPESDNQAHAAGASAGTNAATDRRGRDPDVRGGAVGPATRPGDASGKALLGTRPGPGAIPGPGLRRPSGVSLVGAKPGASGIGSPAGAGLGGFSLFGALQAFAKQGDVRPASSSAADVPQQQAQQQEHAQRRLGVARGSVGVPTEFRGFDEVGGSGSRDVPTASLVRMPTGQTASGTPPTPGASPLCPWSIAGQGAGAGVDGNRLGLVSGFGPRLQHQGTWQSGTGSDGVLDSEAVLAMAGMVVAQASRGSTDGSHAHAGHHLNTTLVALEDSLGIRPEQRRAPGARGRAGGARQGDSIGTATGELRPGMGPGMRFLARLPSAGQSLDVASMLSGPTHIADALYPMVPDRLVMAGGSSYPASEFDDGMGNTTANALSSLHVMGPGPGAGSGGRGAAAGRGRGAGGTMTRGSRDRSAERLELLGVARRVHDVLQGVRIIKVLGAGAHGKVYKASLHDRFVAVKVILHETEAPGWSPHGAGLTAGGPTLVGSSYGHTTAAGSAAGGEETPSVYTGYSGSFEPYRATAASARSGPPARSASGTGSGSGRGSGGPGRGTIGGVRGLAAPLGSGRQDGLSPAGAAGAAAGAAATDPWVADAAPAAASRCGTLYGSSNGSRAGGDGRASAGEQWNPALRPQVHTLRYQRAGSSGLHSLNFPHPGGDGRTSGGIASPALPVLSLPGMPPVVMPHKHMLEGLISASAQHPNIVETYRIVTQLLSAPSMPAFVVTRGGANPTWDTMHSNLPTPPCSGIAHSLGTSAGSRADAARGPAGPAAGTAGTSGGATDGSVGRRALSAQEAQVPWQGRSSASGLGTRAPACGAQGGRGSPVRAPSGPGPVLRKGRPSPFVVGRALNRSNSCLGPHRDAPASALATPSHSLAGSQGSFAGSVAAGGSCAGGLECVEGVTGGGAPSPDQALARDHIAEQVELQGQRGHQEQEQQGVRGHAAAAAGRQQEGLRTFAEEDAEGRPGHEDAALAVHASAGGPTPHDSVIATGPPAKPPPGSTPTIITGLGSEVGAIPLREGSTMSGSAPQQHVGSSVVALGMGRGLTTEDDSVHTNTGIGNLSLRLSSPGGGGPSCGTGAASGSGSAAAGRSQPSSAGGSAQVGHTEPTQLAGAGTGADADQRRRRTWLGFLQDQQLDGVAVEEGLTSEPPSPRGGGGAAGGGAPALPATEMQAQFVGGGAAAPSAEASNMDSADLIMDLLGAQAAAQRSHSFLLRHRQQQQQHQEHGPGQTSTSGTGSGTGTAANPLYGTSVPTVRGSAEDVVWARVPPPPPAVPPPLQRHASAPDVALSAAAAAPPDGPLPRPHPPAPQLGQQLHAPRGTHVQAEADFDGSPAPPLPPSHSGLSIALLSSVHASHASISAANHASASVGGSGNETGGSAANTLNPHPATAAAAAAPHTGSPPQDLFTDASPFSMPTAAGLPVQVSRHLAAAAAAAGGGGGGPPAAIITSMGSSSRQSQPSSAGSMHAFAEPSLALPDLQMPATCGSPAVHPQPSPSGSSSGAATPQHALMASPGLPTIDELTPGVGVSLVPPQLSPSPANRTSAGALGRLLLRQQLVAGSSSGWHGAAEAASVAAAVGPDGSPRTSARPRGSSSGGDASTHRSSRGSNSHSGRLQPLATAGGGGAAAAAGMAYGGQLVPSDLQYDRLSWSNTQTTASTNMLLNSGFTALFASLNTAGGSNPGGGGNGGGGGRQAEGHLGYGSSMGATWARATSHGGGTTATRNTFNSSDTMLLPEPDSYAQLRTLMGSTHGPSAPISGAADAPQRPAPSPDPAGPEAGPVAGSSSRKDLPFHAAASSVREEPGGGSDPSDAGSLQRAALRGIGSWSFTNSRVAPRDRMGRPLNQHHHHHHHQAHDRLLQPAAGGNGAAAAAVAAQSASPPTSPWAGVPVGRGALAPSGRERWQVLIVQELCTRGNLRDAILSGVFHSSNMAAGTQVIAMRQLLDTAAEVASAMAYLHSRTIVHGDLKTANVLLQRNDNDPRGFTAKLGDFGLARQLAPGTAAGAAAAGHGGGAAGDHGGGGEPSLVCSPGGHAPGGPVVTEFEAEGLLVSRIGTVTHMAPEVIADNLMLLASDVYSFGVMLWELYCAQQPFANYTAFQLLSAVVQYDERPQFPVHCPSAFANLAVRCMAKAPRDRPTFQKVLQELGAIRDSLCGGGGPGGGGTITVPLAQAKSEATRILQSHLQIVSGSLTREGAGAVSASNHTNASLVDSHLMSSLESWDVYSRRAGRGG